MCNIIIIRFIRRAASVRACAFAARACVSVRAGATIRAGSRGLVCVYVCVYVRAAVGRYYCYYYRRRRRRPHIYYTSFTVVSPVCRVTCPCVFRVRRVLVCPFASFLFLFSCPVCPVVIVTSIFFVVPNTKKICYNR